MADLAKTARLSVIIDAALVFVVAARSPVSIDRLEVLANQTDWLQTDFWIRTDTVFVGLGVLSFAYVCQHGAFIIAGSLESPTIARWSQVTKAALCVCASLALLCGCSGYLGFLDNTKGNIINNLQVKDVMSNVARSMLGTTMLFVYPMESFVARHVLVVLFFEGRRAHEGEDASILARRDRRIALTVALYFSALLPAILFEDLGNVLAATGAVGGSCLSYIGPGAIYLGVHGDQLMELLKKGSWWRRYVKDDVGGIHTRKRESRKTHQQQTPSETTALMEVGGAKGEEEETPQAKESDNDTTPSCFVRSLQAFTWYILGMPIWVWIARFGERSMVKHNENMALKSPHPLRIGNVAPDTPQTSRATSRQSSRNLEDSPHQLQKNQHQSLSFREGDLARTDSLSGSGGRDGTTLARLIGLPQQQPSSLRQADTSSLRSYQQVHSQGNAPDTPSLNQQIGAKLLAQKRQEQAGSGIEKDPQKATPTICDFLIAVFFIIFGVLALVAGIVSMAIRED